MPLVNSLSMAIYTSWSCPLAYKLKYTWTVYYQVLPPNKTSHCSPSVLSQSTSLDKYHVLQSFLILFVLCMPTSKPAQSIGNAWIFVKPHDCHCKQPHPSSHYFSLDLSRYFPIFSFPYSSSYFAHAGKVNLFKS